jgi:hypothetical protein
MRQTYVLKRGFTGELVRALQELLNITITTVFDQNTEVAVKSFQKRKGLKDDGIVGPMTWKALNYNPEELNADTDITTGANWIEQHRLPEGEFLKEETSKRWIFLHHTAGRHNPKATIDQWAKDQRGRIGTHYVIGGLPASADVSKLTEKQKEWDGRILQAIDDLYWGYHLGAVKSTRMHKQSLSIEICSAGSLTEKGGKFYTWYGEEVHSSQVARLETAYRGTRYYHAYSEAQIKALQALLLRLGDKHDINLRSGVVETLRQNPNDPQYKAFEFSDSASAGHVHGVLTHGQVRKDKSDVFPQKELIQMLIKL